MVALTATLAGVVITGRDDTPSTAPVPVVPAADVLAQAPYLGVACSVPNAIACDRVGLAVRLRRPADRVLATVGGRRFALDAERWGDGTTRFVGFLQPAGLVERLGVPAGDRWVGQGRPHVAVRLTVAVEGGRTVAVSTRVPLAAGFG